MSAQHISIVIDKQGKATVEAHGFQGTACTEKTRQIIESLGPRRDEEMKPDFYAGNEQTQEVSQ
jgi:hypothetical protein